MADGSFPGGVLPDRNRPSTRGPSGLRRWVHPTGRVLLREVEAQRVTRHTGRCRRRLRRLRNSGCWCVRTVLGGLERACVFHPTRRETLWNWPMGGSGTKQGREDWCGVTPRMVEITWGLHSRGWNPGVGRCARLMSSRVAEPHGRAVSEVVPFACEHTGRASLAGCSGERSEHEAKGTRGRL